MIVKKSFCQGVEVIITLQSFVEKHWNEHGKPAAEVVIQKVLQLIAEWPFKDCSLCSKYSVLSLFIN